MLFHTLVAHGKASGADVLLVFSNKDGSEMSSLGFYRTAPTTYTGKHGVSLKIRGLDPGFNTNAESRAVVVHGADYVRTDFMRAAGWAGARAALPCPWPKRSPLCGPSRVGVCCTCTGPREPATARSG